MNKLNLSQKGVTLIELLIAMTLAIIIILAMSRVFITIGKMTAESSLGAGTDSSLMLGLISIDKIMQSIGYDAATPLVYGTNFAVRAANGTLITKGTAGPIFVWKSGAICQALANETDGLNLYSSYSCSEAIVPSTGATKTLLMPIKSANTTIKNSNNRIGEFEFKVSDATNCTPFGIINSNPAVSGLVGKFTIEVTAYSYAASSDSVARQIRNTTCLLNP
ncbi:prepilin-type N-terminal cleavage/methylation domain-containing protein [Acinetobacter sp. SwsAc2]|uniref:PilW family protein n=1 Tax=Acinetobacter sp. SwsAc2 TaxID=2749360 RepID=UPI0015BF39F5|nr:prepilin-type N-terminal cleavage/methylation domain-containing protein [Acinetobacter sp. SwsAc2]NWK60891.1 prepilin-type N-terminal cleavage/methylation domain-containing protein [Acinetobacter sp. SwsAc2]